MIKLATVFSGIGAIEHALNRMDIDYEVVFACDNGDIDIFSKKINVNLDEIERELESLHSLLNNMNLHKEGYEEQLLLMFNLANEEYQNIENILKPLDISNIKRQVNNVLKNIVQLPNLNKNRLKLFNKYLYDLNYETSSLSQIKLLIFQIILKLSNDFKRDNSIEDLGNYNVNFTSQYNIDWNNIHKELNILYAFLDSNHGKKINNNVRNLSQRVGQLYGKINSLHHLNEVNKLQSYSDKKKYVDDLYKAHENRNKVKISYMANYKCSQKDFHWDVTFLDGHQYNNQVDLFVGGSPCQSFSSLGKKRGLSDTRGTLFYEYARLVDEVQPKVFIYENVRAVLSNDCGKTWKKMKEVFEDLGYNIYFTYEDKPSVLNAKNYGIPQSRNRIFVVGFRSDLQLVQDFEFPKHIPLKYKMPDFLLDNAPEGSFLPKMNLKFKKNKNSKNDSSKIADKYFLSERIKKTILSAGPNDLYGEPKIDREIALPLLSTMHKMHRAGTDNYVTTNGKIRRLTPREALRLMGFADDWKIVVSDTSAYQQAGNSIVVDVLINIVFQIVKSYPSLVSK